MNQFGLDIVIRRMLFPGGFDVDLYDEYNCKDELHNIIVQADKWYIQQQYESRLHSLRDYSLLTHNPTEIFHHDIFESKRAMGLLEAPYFDMNNNFYKKIYIRP